MQQCQDHHLDDIKTLKQNSLNREFVVSSYTHPKNGKDQCGKDFKLQLPMSWVSRGENKSDDLNSVSVPLGLMLLNVAARVVFMALYISPDLRWSILPIQSLKRSKLGECEATALARAVTLPSQSRSATMRVQMWTKCSRCSRWFRRARCSRYTKCTWLEE